MADIHIADNNSDEVVRPGASFSPSLWADRFSSLPVIDDEIKDKWLKEVEELKAEMRRRLTNLRGSAVEEKLSFIDKLQRLGIAYLFQNEIEEELHKIFESSSQVETEMIDKQDLSIVSLYFRLLRQQGFHVSSKIFDGFKDDDCFKSPLRTDVMGLLNLYEASHIRIHGEDILDKAVAFASTNLELMIPHLTPSLSKRVSHALNQPFCRGLPRIEAHFFISLYEEEKDSKNDLVHRLAKLDYNLLQILHRKELASLSSWWNDVLPKYPFARDRSVEIYFWGLGLYYEPQFSIARVMVTRTILMLTVIDDAYDAYGTVDELKVFTEAVQRWDISEIDNLPESMKALYKGLLQLYVIYEEDLQKLGRSFALTYAKQLMKRQLQSYYIEAKWFLEGKTPTFDEYLKHASVTFGVITTATTALLGVESVTKESFEWLQTPPPILTACSAISRLLNDIANCEAEKERGQLTTGIDCYMKQYGVTIEEAKDGMEKYIENAWKDMYEGCLGPTAPDNIILTRILNFARLAELTYKHKYDGFSNPEGMKHHILALLVDPFEI